MAPSFVLHGYLRRIGNAILHAMTMNCVYTPFARAAVPLLALPRHGLQVTENDDCHVVR